MKFAGILVTVLLDHGSGLLRTSLRQVSESGDESHLASDLAAADEIVQDGQTQNAETRESELQAAWMRDNALLLAQLEDGFSGKPALEALRQQASQIQNVQDAQTLRAEKREHELQAELGGELDTNERLRAQLQAELAALRRVDAQQLTAENETEALQASIEERKRIWSDLTKANKVSQQLRKRMATERTAYAEVMATLKAHVVSSAN